MKINGTIIIYNLQISSKITSLSVVINLIIICIMHANSIAGNAMNDRHLEAVWKSNTDLAEELETEMDNIQISSEHQHRFIRSSESIHDHIQLEPQTAQQLSELSSNLTEEEKELALRTHNYYRMREGASNMNYMYWNEDLATIAQAWANRCDFRHGKPEGIILKDYNSSSRQGQNLWAYTRRKMPSMDYVIQPWFDEKEYFNFEDQTCKEGEKCGHYKLMVQAHAYHLGCGMSWCMPLYDTREGEGYVRFQSGWYVVCHYGPKGNIKGIDPYKKGKPCTKCENDKFTCRDGMCDNCKVGVNNCSCEGSTACQNCATVTQDCKCSCLPGYTGPYCSAICEDRSNKCNNGWYPPRCYNNYIRKKCPLMCQLCEPATNSTPICESTEPSVTTPTTTTFEQTKTTATKPEINSTAESKLQKNTSTELPTTRIASDTTADLMEATTANSSGTEETQESASSLVNPIVVIVTVLIINVILNAY